jgi:hypothetical protein
MRYAHLSPAYLSAEVASWMRPRSQLRARNGNKRATRLDGRAAAGEG